MENLWVFNIRRKRSAIPRFAKLLGPSFFMGWISWSCPRTISCWQNQYQVRHFVIHPNVRSSLSATSTMVRIQHFLSFIVAVLPAFNASISEIISVSRPSPAANFILIFQSSHRLPFSYALHPRPFSQSHTFDLLSKVQWLTCSGMHWNVIFIDFEAIGIILMF